jgi:hypothetical protein
MRKRLVVINLVALVALGFGAKVLGQGGPPPVDVGERHGNMRSAQEAIRQAWLSVDTAQKDNSYNLGGHAGRAKELLSQASNEIKQAAEDANHHH